jgi:hypothetical protein
MLFTSQISPHITLVNEQCLKFLLEVCNTEESLIRRHDFTVLTRSSAKFAGKSIFLKIYSVLSFLQMILNLASQCSFLFGIIMSTFFLQDSHWKCGFVRVLLGPAVWTFTEVNFYTTWRVDFFIVSEVPVIATIVLLFASLGLDIRIYIGRCVNSKINLLL